MSEKYKRSTPEEALEKVKEETHGKLKIFLGYAPGVGKTYSMLNEANRRHQRGHDIVIGHLDTHKRCEAIDQIRNLQIIPPKEIIYDGKVYNEVDVEAIIAKKPKTVVIDELAHENAPGSKNLKRYEDIQEILSSGINVITTLNIEHIESLNTVIRKITGTKITNIIPDSIIENADQVVVVDLSPDELLKRLNNGEIYAKNSTSHAVKNFYRKNNLSALRELTLRLTAEGVDEDLALYMKSHGIHENWHTVERVMVCISTNVNAKKLIRRGARIASKYKCEWYVVNVHCTSIFAPALTYKNKETLNSNIKLAKQIGAEVIILNGKSISRTLADFASEKYITQIIIGSSRRTKAQYLLRGSTVTKLIKYTKNVEFHVVPSD